MDYMGQFTVKTLCIAKERKGGTQSLSSQFGQAARRMGRVPPSQEYSLLNLFLRVGNGSQIMKSYESERMQNPSLIPTFKWYGVTYKDSCNDQAEVVVHTQIRKSDDAMHYLQG